MKGLIIIPAYNEGHSIRTVLEHLKSTLPQELDLVVVNDGSKDNTYQEVISSDTDCLNLPCNLGYTGALKSGLRYGLQKGYDTFGFMDSDGQHRTEDMIALHERFSQNDLDLLVGSRWMNHGPDESSSTGRRLGMQFFAWLTQKLTSQKFSDTTSGMKMLNRAVAEELLYKNFGDLHAEVLIYLHDRGYRISEHPIVVYEREAGTSMYSLHDAVLYPVKNLILISIFKLNSWTLKRVDSK
jgi:glycosyltransferase involved in cell wall biosynthesis